MRYFASACLCAGLLSVQAATAMTLNPRGTGQVLLFPYFTVNHQQQTLISVSNTTAQGKALKVHFREALNGREVLSFQIFLAAHDTWTGALFALGDAGLPGSGAALLVVDTSCTQPDIATISPKLADGRPYQPLLDYAYSGANSDTGPTDDARTREGFFEIIEMAQLTGDTLAAITPVHGVPTRCSALLPQVPAIDLSAPGGGLVGAEAIVNVAQGTLFSTNAYAIDGFANTSLYGASGSIHPHLGDATPGANGFVSAYVPIGGSYATLDYPPAHAIDAVSALLMADALYGEWDNSPSEGAQTDWVVTMPTKRFYTDSGDSDVADPRLTNALPPFTYLFGEKSAGNATAFSAAHFNAALFDRDGQDVASVPAPCPWECPPSAPFAFGYNTQVVTFAPSPGAASGALGSNLLTLTGPAQLPTGVGTASFDLVGAEAHELRPDAHGTVLRGLPVIGFAAVDYINGNVTPGILSNYSGTYPLRARLDCAVLFTTPPGAASPCGSP